MKWTRADWERVFPVDADGGVTITLGDVKKADIPNEVLFELLQGGVPEPWRTALLEIFPVSHITLRMQVMVVELLQRAVSLLESAVQALARKE